MLLVNRYYDLNMEQQEAILVSANDSVGYMHLAKARTMIVGDELSQRD